MSHQNNQLHKKKLPLPDKEPGKFEYPDEVKKVMVVNPHLSKKKTRKVSFLDDEDNDEDDDSPPPPKLNARDKWMSVLSKPEFKRVWYRLRGAHKPGWGARGPLILTFTRKILQIFVHLS